MAWTREEMAARAAEELQDGFYVNLGIGIPTLVANYIPADMNVTLQSENGMLGIGPFPYEGEEDPDLINAGKQTDHRTADQRASSPAADRFAMIRGGHIDLTILGAMRSRRERRHRQLDDPRQDGRRAWAARWTWSPASRSVVVVMDHANKAGDSKLLKPCTLPLTGAGVVDMIVTDLGVFVLRQGEGRPDPV